MQTSRAKPESDFGFTSYFLEKISELPADSCGHRSQGQNIDDMDSYERQRAFNMNFESSVSFPSKLYKCLVDAETKGFTDVISWQPDGASFKVHNQERFVNDILPLYFGAIKFKSWQRQLNLYGFTRVHKGLTRGSYTHDHFVRGRKSLSLEISRQKWTNTNTSGSSVVMPKDSDCMTDYTPYNVPYANVQGNMSQFKAKDSFVGNFMDGLKGPAWQNDILVDRGNLSGAPSAPMFKVGTNYSGSDQEVMPVDMDSLSVDSGTSAVMPSAEELSFLLDFDERQMSKDRKMTTKGHGSLANQSQASQSQMNDFGQGNYGINSNSLQVIANTLPPACDLTDLSVGDNVSQAASVMYPQEATSSAPTATPTSCEPRSFPWKLHEMLSEVESNGFQDIISWEPDGMSFKVHDCRLFVEKVMPLYFDQSRYESFRRQLRKYGFSRLHKDRYRGAYHHKHFQKANKSLCKYISRGNKGDKKEKSMAKEAISQHSSEKK